MHKEPYCDICKTTNTRWPERLISEEKEAAFQSRMDALRAWLFGEMKEKECVAVAHGGVLSNMYASGNPVKAKFNNLAVLRIKMQQNGKNVYVRACKVVYGGVGTRGVPAPYTHDACPCCGAAWTGTTKTVYMIRHAESVNNVLSQRKNPVQWAIESARMDTVAQDAYLSEKGISDTERVRKYVLDAIPSTATRVFASPLRRTLQTALLLFSDDTTRLPIQIAPIMFEHRKSWSDVSLLLKNDNASELQNLKTKLALQDNTVINFDSLSSLKTNVCTELECPR